MPDIPQGCVLAFDFGEVRIGVAQGNGETRLAHPLTTVTGQSNADKFAAIGRLVDEWRPDYLVVGVPLHTDGTEHELSRLARLFGRRLHGRFALPVYWADERFTSLYAEELLHQARVSAKKQKAVLDSVAAQAILQGFFDGGGVGEPLLERAA